MQVKQRTFGIYKGAVERVTARRTASAFLDKGVLSVPEFVLAGDNLVAKFPIWSLCAGDPSKRKPYLPADKQYLVTRNVPCLRRAVSVEKQYDAAAAEVVLDDDDEDGEGWLATHGVQAVVRRKKRKIYLTWTPIKTEGTTWLLLGHHTLLQTNWKMTTSFAQEHMTLA